MNHSVVAELLHGARRERGFYGGLYGTRVTALVTGQACLQDLREQTVEDLIRMASDFTRKQPALVFGLASLAGFLAFRVIKSTPPESSTEQDPMSERFGGRTGQSHGI